MSINPATKRGNRSLFGKQVPLYFRRLDGLLDGQRVVSVDPYAVDLIGNEKPGTNTFSWFNQKTLADNVTRGDNTVLIQHDGPDSPDGSGAVYYETVSDVKHRVELSARWLLTLGSTTDYSRLGIAFMDASNEILAVAKSHGPGFNALEFIETVYRPVQPDSTTGEVLTTHGVVGSYTEFLTLIAEYDPSTGLLEAWLSINLGAGTSYQIKVAETTQLLTGALDRIGIYTTRRLGYGHQLDVWHWKVESLA